MAGQNTTQTKKPTSRAKRKQTEPINEEIQQKRRPNLEPFN